MRRSCAKLGGLQSSLFTFVITLLSAILPMSSLGGRLGQIRSSLHVSLLPALPGTYVRSITACSTSSDCVPLLRIHALNLTCHAKRRANYNSNEHSSFNDRWYCRPMVQRQESLQTQHPSSANSTSDPSPLGRKRITGLPTGNGTT